MARLAHTTLDHADALSFGYDADGVLEVGTRFTLAQVEGGAARYLIDAIAEQVGPCTLWRLILID